MPVVSEGQKALNDSNIVTGGFSGNLSCARDIFVVSPVTDGSALESGSTQSPIRLSSDILTIPGNTGIVSIVVSTDLKAVVGGATVHFRPVLVRRNPNGTEIRRPLQGYVSAPFVAIRPSGANVEEMLSGYALARFLEIDIGSNLVRDTQERQMYVEVQYINL